MKTTGASLHAVVVSLQSVSLKKKAELLEQIAINQQILQRLVAVVMGNPWCTSDHYVNTADCTEVDCQAAEDHFNLLSYRCV